VCVIGLVAVLATPAAQQRPSGALTPQIESVLKKIKAADKGQLAVSEEDGRFLRVLIATRGAKSILEIGGASGYSGIWLGLGARESGGRVVSIEYDPQRAKEAADTCGSRLHTDCGHFRSRRIPTDLCSSTKTGHPTCRPATIFHGQILAAGPLNIHFRVSRNARRWRLIE